MLSRALAALIFAGCTNTVTILGGGPDECTRCNGAESECVDLQSDVTNCGACGVFCQGRQTCQDGTCVGEGPVCTPPMATCNGVCADLSDDPEHCGGCNIGCGFNESCDGGVCLDSVPCGFGETLCGGECVDTFTDPDHCGACNNSCGPNTYCTSGGCACEGNCNVCEVNDLGSIVPTTVVGVATQHSVEPSCVQSEGVDVGWLFMPPVGGTYTFDTNGSSYDTVLHVRDLVNCQEIACNDDFNGTNSQVTLSLPSNAYIAVIVDAFSENDSGQYQLNVTNTVSSCPESTLPSVTPQMLTGTVGGPSETGSSCGGGGGPETSFVFTVPMNGSYTFDTHGSNFDTVLYLRDSCNGNELVCNDDFGAITSQITANLLLGQQVIIFVDTFGTNGGSFILNIVGP